MVKEHPAAVQADQMNSYMEFFVDHQGSQEGGGEHHPDNVVVEEVVVDDHHGMDVMDKNVVLMDADGDDDSLLDGSHLSHLEEDMGDDDDDMRWVLRGKGGGAYSDQKFAGIVIKR